uniref:Rho GTPase activating protein 27 n=1 Tax=Cyprinus carpio TaxID=7962 RepID=A0A8C1S591_CYPCA
KCTQKCATMSLSQQVLVNYEYTYTARDGREVSIKPNEHYILVAKTNETWWHVRSGETDKPFFIPATYVTELPPETNQTSLEVSRSESLKLNSETAPDRLPAIIEPAEVTLRVPASIKRDTEKDDHHIWVSLASCLVQVHAFTGVIFVHQVEDDSALTAVYVNLPRLRRSITDTSSTIASPLQEFPEPPDTLLLDSAGWEIHTDDQSGKEYYFHPSTGRSTWEYPLSSSMESSVRTEEACSPPSFPQSPISSPIGPSPQRWSSDWEKVLDENTGRHYFFNIVSGQSSWDPPEDITSPEQFLEDCPPPLPEEDYPYTLIQVKKLSIPRASLDHSVPPGWTLSIDAEGAWVFTSDYTQEQWIKSLDDQGRIYYYLRDGSDSQWNLPEVRYSGGIWDCPPEGLFTPRTITILAVSMKMVMFVCKSITFYKSSHRKNWSNSWTVLHGGILTFHKDPKSPAGSKTNQIVPEFIVELKGATINWASKDKSSKKNVLELKSRNGVEYLVQYDTESIITDWYKIISDTIRQLDTENEYKNVLPSSCSVASRHPSSTSTPEADQKKVPDFCCGCSPSGLGIDGLYRVSGNLAVIQKLRFKADHEDLDLEEGNWDIHVITGALKLFFRELQEPLFPYSLFNDFISGISKIPKSHMRSLVRSLPPPNRDTMEALFSHLRKVIQHGDENRMSVQNVAIVFGPTLLKPEVETASIATYLVFQNQIVEFLLNEFDPASACK